MAHGGSAGAFGIPLPGPLRGTSCDHRVFFQTQKRKQTWPSSLGQASSPVGIGVLWAVGSQGGF